MKENENLIKTNPKRFSPSQFMKNRRPEKFSDSKVDFQKELSRDRLEYHLETLTSRKQEYEFERFCTLLVEKELCPNLMPQTGPTGGGDSKVDTETHPVADSIAASWYDGLGREAKEERWAFAFSTKKQWAPKVRTDVEKIASTGREYKLIYFISNQFISDKKRATIEDELTKKYVIPVRILDRNWIVDCVLRKGRVDIAIEALGLDPSYKKKRILGANDRERELELKKIDDFILSKSKAITKYQLVEELLRTAILSRELERSQNEVYGRFDRAITIAKEIRYKPQLIRIKYAKAWTGFWWYEDIHIVDSMYSSIEALTLSGTDSEDLERLTNLWIILMGASHNLNNNISLSIGDRTTKLENQLKAIVKNVSRPNNAMYARSLLATIKLTQAIIDKTKAQDALLEINKIFKKSKILKGFPISILTNIIFECAEFLPDILILDKVYETAVAITERNVSSEKAGELLLKRAYQKIKLDKPYDALSLFERAENKIADREHRKLQIFSLMGSCYGYENVGLFWAARSSAILATEMAFSQFNESGNGAKYVLRGLRRLFWLELKLGRVLQTLFWKKLAIGLSQSFGVAEESVDETDNEEEVEQDYFLGLLLLKSNFEDLHHIGFLPSLLEKYDLLYSRVAILFALGYEEEVQKISLFQSEPIQNILDFFIKWKNQPVANDLPSNPVFFFNKHAVLQSSVLGINLTIEIDHSPTSLKLAETFLSSCEALLAGSLDENLIPHKSEYKIRITLDPELTELPEYKFYDSGAEYSLEISVPKDISLGLVKKRNIFRSWLIQLILQVLARIVYFKNGAESIGPFLKNKKHTIERATRISDIMVSSLEESHSAEKLWIEDHKESPACSYKMQRTKIWDTELETTNSDQEKSHKPIKYGSGEPPKELLDISNLKHTQRHIESLIDIELWNMAGWHGTGFQWERNSTKPPFLLLLFSDKQSAVSIFKGFQNRIGSVDHQEILHITIIRGISRANPHCYRLIVSSNLKKALEHVRAKQFILTSRFSTMMPTNSVNLDEFIKQYTEKGIYLIAPAYVDSSQNSMTPLLQFAIQKKELEIKWAWEIGRHDPNMIGILSDDDPIIPEEVKKPPVLEVLRFKKMHNKFSSNVE